MVDDLKRRDAWRRWYTNHHDEILVRRRNWYANHVGEERSRRKISYQNRRDLVFDHYGRKCACCGEDRIEFLTIDHVDGSGNEHRKSVGNGGKVYDWLVRHNFPDGFQTLCWNCNCAKFIYGECPHRRKS